MSDQRPSNVSEELQLSGSDHSVGLSSMDGPPYEGAMGRARSESMSSASSVGSVAVNCHGVDNQDLIVFFKTIVDRLCMGTEKLDASGLMERYELGDPPYSLESLGQYLKEYDYEKAVDSLTGGSRLDKRLRGKGASGLVRDFFVICSGLAAPQKKGFLGFTSTFAVLEASRTM